MSEVYLLDSNCFIAPARTFYGYDFAPSFWKQLRSVLVRPDVLVIKFSIQVGLGFREVFDGGPDLVIDFLMVAVDGSRVVVDFPALLILAQEVWMLQQEPRFADCVFCRLLLIFHIGLSLAAFRGGFFISCISWA